MTCVWGENKTCALNGGELLIRNLEIAQAVKPTKFWENENEWDFSLGQGERKIEEIKSIVQLPLHSSNPNDKRENTAAANPFSLLQQAPDYVLSAQ